eukprot:TRINITY_DN66498_c1_g1_i1.p2 TRINITY_DN66498_c1_g1~~TRINITY_DN66498_c1_g1_i1.p2  ORF type:complete len:111 (+),score=0.59 TRINITY_DN66498_c1_g1_i1:925-1257(+)
MAVMQKDIQAWPFSIITLQCGCQPCQTPYSPTMSQDISMTAPMNSVTPSIVKMRIPVLACLVTNSQQACPAAPSLLLSWDMGPLAWVLALNGLARSLALHSLVCVGLYCM